MTRYLPAEIAAIAPDADTAPFWDACRERRLVIQRCAACGLFRHPPIAGCPSCGSRSTDWVAVAGTGMVYSYTIVRHAVTPELAPHVPYNAALIALDGAPGVKLISNVVDASPEEMRIGLPVEVAWEEARPGVVLPRFRKRPDAAR